MMKEFQFLYEPTIPLNLPSISVKTHWLSTAV